MIGSMPDALGIKRQYPLHSRCLSNAGHPDDRKSGCGTLHRIPFKNTNITLLYGIITEDELSCVRQGKRVSWNIPLPDRDGYPLFDVDMRVKRLEILEQPFNAVYAVLGIQIAFTFMEDRFCRQVAHSPRRRPNGRKCFNQRIALVIRDDLFQIIRLDRLDFRHSAVPPNL